MRYSANSWAGLVALASLAVVTPTMAQVGVDRDDYLGPRPLPGGAVLGPTERTFPRPQYYFPFAAYYDGRFSDALEQFQDCARSTRKVPGPWIDAISHRAMLGECYYQMGRLDEAFDEYTATLQITLAYPKWLERVQFAEELRTSSAPRYGTTPWGQSRRNPTLGHFPSETNYLDGDVDNTKPVTQGGIVRPAQYIRINVYEIVRGTCLALRRRHQLMGSIGYTDPLHQQFVEFYDKANRNGWPRFLYDVPLGFAYRAAGKDPQAQAIFERCLTIDGFDHPYTGMVLLELGQIARAAGDAALAADYLVEATYAAAHYDDADTIETAFGELLGLERTLNKERDLPSLMLVANWAGSRDLRKLRVMLLANAAERQAALGQTEDAASILSQADQLVGRRDMRAARGGARLNFVEALVRYQQNEVADGDRLVSAAVDWERRGSPRQFQFQLLDRRLSEGELTSRTAVAHFAELLREPSGEEWTRDPLDALSAWSAKHRDAYDDWFLMAWERHKPDDLALLMEIAERARRHRFLTSLELGGRPQSLRWLIATPAEQLSPPLRLQSQDLLIRFPELKQIRQVGTQLRTQFAQLASSNENELRRPRPELLGQLQDQVNAETRMLRELSLRREPAGIAFPPIRTVPEIQRSLPPRHALLTFANVREKTFGFLVMRDKYQVWEVGSTAKIHDDVANLLKAWHHSHGRRSLSASELSDPAWKKLASALLPFLTSGAASGFPGSLEVDELAIVPEGALWYLPFEALLTGSTDKPAPLIASVRIRYAPTAGLAVERRQPVPVERTTVLLGKMVPREDDESIAAALAALEKAAPGSIGWNKPVSETAAIAATLSGRLIVLDEVPLDGKKPYDWSPLGVNRGDTETTVADWLGLPWPTPRELLLPGFYTAAESGLHRERGASYRDREPAYRGDAHRGDELFLSLMGLAGAGTRTLLISRWRTGGVTTRDEVREFVQELPFTSPADSWQRSALLCMQARLDPVRESRLTWKGGQPPPLAEHPFFWAAPMLIDCGINADEVPEADPLEEPPRK